MNTSTCATTDPRQYSRRSRQRRRAKQLRRRRMIVALIALGLAFFLGYLSGCGMQRARNPQTVPSTALAATVARVECTETTTTWTETEATEATQPPTEPVRYRDDIVSDGRLLSYELQEWMQDCCAYYSVPYALALAIAEVETHFDPDAVSPTNDYGLMQINKVNHEWLLEIGIDPTTHEGNIEAGVRIISGHLQTYGDVERALMAYNCGPTGARRLWDQGIFETEYSRNVMTAFEYWTSVLEG